MSEGPVKAWRDGHRAPRSAKASERVCAPGSGATAGRAYCGRKSTTRAQDWKGVTCVDCHAMRRADMEATR